MARVGVGILYEACGATMPDYWRLSILALNLYAIRWVKLASGPSIVSWKNSRTYRDSEVMCVCLAELLETADLVPRLYLDR